MGDGSGSQAPSSTHSSSREVAEALAKKGVKALIGEGAGLTPEPGQVLGCSYAAATRLPEDVDGYIFIGGGRFHPLGLALKTGKPIVVANPYNGSVLELDEVGTHAARQEEDGAHRRPRRQRRR